MPIEIKELHIKINVDEKAQTTNNNQMVNVNQQALISSCVEAVIEILDNKKER